MILLFATFGSLGVEVQQWEKYQGTDKGSNKELAALCLDYMQRGWLENNPQYYLHLLPPSIERMEQQIMDNFRDTHKKRFMGLTESTFAILKLRSIKNGTYKGHATTRVNVKYQGLGVEQYKNGMCFFEQLDNQRWYFGGFPQ